MLLGRLTYQLTRKPGAPPWPPGWRVYVFSRTLDPEQHPGVTIVTTDAEAAVARLRAETGRDIWLFGGASLFASLLTANVVDQVEVAIMPVLLGGGIPLVASGIPFTRLTLSRSDAYPSGIATLAYDIQNAAG